MNEEVRFICRHSAGAAKYRAVADDVERLGQSSTKVNKIIQVFLVNRHFSVALRR
jgi:hypothetical protein